MSKTTSPTLKMRCVFPFCNSQGVTVKIGKPGRKRGARFMDYTAVCDCRARWSFTEDHFKLLDKAGLIKLTK